MNKRDIKRLNVVPEGKTPWLSYEDYAKLGQLFDRVSHPEEMTIDSAYREIYDFLTTVAGLELPASTESIHFNAFVLLRRGYKVEEITETECSDLLRLMDGLEEPDKYDMNLYDTGGHRDLYNYLSRQMGLSVEAGRGPVWYRAKALIEKYEETQQATLV